MTATRHHVMPLYDHLAHCRVAVVFYGMMIAIGCVVLFALTARVAHAASDFQLNFNATLTTPSFTTCGVGQDCTIKGGDFPTGGGTFSGNDGSRFIQEQVTINNGLFFHVVVGDPALGFVNESYTRASTTTATNPNKGQSSRTTKIVSPFSPDSGGNEINTIKTIGIGNQAALTGGVGRKGLGKVHALFGNGLDPLGAGKLANGAQVSIADSSRVSGSGTGDPSRTVLRMVVSDGQMSQEVNKPLLNRKPLITQVTTDNSFMTSEFMADMRGLTYSQKNRTISIVNRFTLTDPRLPVAGSADFDMTKVQRSHVTAGQFDFTPGPGWNTTEGWAHQTLDPVTGQLVHDAVFTPGSYSGPGAGFDPLAVKWSDFFDKTQNSGCITSSTKRFKQSVCP